VTRWICSFEANGRWCAPRASADKSGQPLAKVMAKRAAAIPVRRFGQAEEFGALCAFICSVQAGYLTGQNILLDGGAYPGTF
jgi:3-oxoacyl-[acyl-carrier protein] reductase